MPPIKSRADLISWIDSCVLGDLRTLLSGVDAYYASADHIDPNGRPVGAANFVLVAGCCSAIEYFGHILGDGSNKEARSLAFLRRFLHPVNARYAEIDAVLWKCFRHGTVHRSWPKRIIVEGQSDTVLTGAGTELCDTHLGPAPGQSGDSFLVNGRQLLRDLELAFEREFRGWILKNGTADVLRRANPEDLRISNGDVAGKAQVAKIRQWSRQNRARPA